MSNGIRRYVAVILKGPGARYLATVPDLGACFGTGRTIEEARDGLPDALALHVEGMLADGRPLPDPRSRAAVLATLDDPVVADYIIEIEPDAPPATRPSAALKK